MACWAHLRRKIFDIHTTNPTPLTTDLPACIGAIYESEAGIRGTPPDNRRRSRQERSLPLVDELRHALDDTLRRLSTKSEMAKALSYGRKRWAALTRFLDDGRLEIDDSEQDNQAIRVGGLPCERRARHAVCRVGPKELVICWIKSGWGPGGCNLYGYRDRQAQRSRTPSVYRRCNRKDRWWLARITLG